jgi:crotonobetainyl-CoA:carnitine CoA-transferase CaiB-like acyl-CoA transferase
VGHVPDLPAALSYQFMSPLTGLRVLDFSHALAGPYCTMLLAQYGADVLKIEDPSGGDVGRSWGPPFTGDQASYFLGLNAGKRSLAIDLKKPEGLQLCLDLAANADILIENMRPGTMTRLGLGYEAIRARNPKLIYCAISGYGQTGPARDDAAMDLIVQASSGLISTTGVEGGEKVRSGHSVADITAGMFAIIGIQLALEARHKTGEGQFVDVSMMDGMISAMASNYAFYFGSGAIPEPMGTRFATIVPYRGFPTKDREIVIAVASQKLWRTFCAAIGRSDLAGHPDYATNRLRVENRLVLEPLITEILKSRTSGEWCKLFSEHGIPCSPVRNLEEVVNDPQSAAREMFREAGGALITGPPVKLSATPGAAKSQAPKLGADTRATLAELLKLDEAALEALAKSGAIK